MNKIRYYASFVEVIDGVAVFESREKRDEWVNYQDEFAVFMEETAEDPIFHRMALTAEEAEKITFSKVNDPDCYSEDEFNPDIKWVDTIFRCSYKEWVDLMEE